MEEVNNSDDFKKTYKTRSKKYLYFKQVQNVFKTTQLRTSTGKYIQKTLTTLEFSKINAKKDTSSS